jgi:hypothetical protein
MNVMDFGFTVDGLPIALTSEGRIWQGVKPGLEYGHMPESERPGFVWCQLATPAPDGATRLIVRGMRLFCIADGQVYEWARDHTPTGIPWQVNFKWLPVSLPMET